MTSSVDSLHEFIRDLAKRITIMLELEVNFEFCPGMRVRYSWKGQILTGELCPGKSEKSAIHHTVVTLDDYACYLLVKSDKTGKTYPVRHQNIRIEGEDHEHDCIG